MKLGLQSVACNGGSGILFTNTCPCNIQIFFQKKILKISSDFLFCKISNTYAQNIDCGYTLGQPRRGGSNEYPQSMFLINIKKNRYAPAYSSFAI